MGGVIAKKKFKPTYTPDPDEDAAVDKAAAVFADSRQLDAHTATYRIISAWILERTFRARMRGEAVTLDYGLDDAHLEGVAKSVLPGIGERLAELEIDDSKPFFELPPEQVIAVVVTAFLHMAEATKMNGQIPF